MTIGTAKLSSRNDYNVSNVSTSIKDLAYWLKSGNVRSAWGQDTD